VFVIVIKHTLDRMDIINGIIIMTNYYVLFVITGIIIGRHDKEVGSGRTILSGIFLCSYGHFRLPVKKLEKNICKELN